MRNYYLESIDAAVAELGRPSNYAETHTMLQRAQEILIDTRCPLNDPAWNDAFNRIQSEIELAELELELAA